MRSASKTPFCELEFCTDGTQAARAVCGMVHTNLSCHAGCLCFCSVLLAFFREPRELCTCALQLWICFRPCDVARSSIWKRTAAGPSLMATLSREISRTDGESGAVIHPYCIAAISRVERHDDPRLAVVLSRGLQ